MRSILVVEDDGDIRQSLIDVLRSAGYRLRACGDGQAALRAVQEEIPDLIILDLMLPILDGWGFRVQQKGDPNLSKIPVIAMSADGSAKALAIDADLFLRKPFELSELLSGVERLLLMADRRKLQAQAAESDRLISLGTISAGVAHEINNPLAYVAGNLEVLARRLPDLIVATDMDHDEKLSLLRALEHAQDGANRIRAIVADLRTFSRMEQDSIGPVNVERVLDSAINILGNALKHRARVVKDYGGVSTVIANEGRLGQLFINLILNAAQAIPEGNSTSNEVRIATNEANGRVLIQISDTGCGIPPDVKTRIFEPFFTTKAIGEGTGLGLAICHGIVTAVGGRIDVVSDPGKGACFTIEVPAGEELALEQTAERPALSLDPDRRGKILIIDDEPMICGLMERLLGVDHDVTTSMNANNALDLLGHGERFDVILCDLMMPDKNGIDLYEELCTTSPDQAKRMIFLTGGAFTPRAVSFIAQVECPVLEKPFDMGRLLGLVRDRVANGSAAARNDAVA